MKHPKISFTQKQYETFIRRARAAVKPVAINQRVIEFGTNNRWFDARVIDRNPAWVEPPSPARYVWSRSNPGAERAIISRSFTLPRPRRIRSAELFLSVDNYAIVLINGRPVIADNPQAETSFFNPGRTFNIRRFLRRRINDIVIIAFNFGGPRSEQNPAGVAARVRIVVD